MSVARRLVGGLGEKFGELLEEEDFTEVVWPHVDEVAWTSVAIITVAIGEEGGLIKWGGDVGRKKPFAATASGGNRGVSFDVGDPAAMVGVAVEEPRSLSVEGGKADGAGGASEGGSDLIFSDG